MIEHELEQQEAPLLRSVGARRFDASFVTGALVAGILLLVAMFSSGHFLRFLSPTSLLIVLGGTFAALVINFSLSDLHNAWRACREVLFERGEEPLDRILYLVDLAPRVKREGVLMLEQEADRVKDPLLAKAFELLADGQTPRR
jgi:chemotaxis protein MotA